ncbi:17849_t:CDS:2 [Cetraspora pellucida]|uniref:17849_t:CDS:1 n=1 Tax=Cetraspora pellucida TaxID=1433469 RepID=A0A9N8VXD5_9GLOM|nr:17849_t:CDS:2 [Cetraspora pellucida]
MSNNTQNSIITSTSTTTPSYKLRASLTPTERITTVLYFTGAWTLILGSYEGGKKAGLQYLAENAHKLPKTKGGWYFYHKRKNYRIFIGGMKSGVRLAMKTSLVCLTFTGLEAMLDEVRKENDFLNSCGAGLTTALIVSGIYRFPRQSIKYACMIGLGVGIITGGLQDAVRFYQGQNIWYWDLIKKNRV